MTTKAKYGMAHQTAVPAPRILALDGIRGIAILWVLFHHLYLMHYVDFFPAWSLAIAKGGWAGVDLFFVLSGYLITGILYDAKGQPNYFKNFYLRRILRIWPLYYLLLSVVFVVVPQIAARPAAITGHSGWGLPYWFFVNNIWSVYLGGWSDGWLGPTWSLAIEEQFYVIWPVTVLLTKRSSLSKICIGLLIGSVALRIGLTLGGIPAARSYFLTFTRFDGLVIGAFVAILARSPAALAPYLSLATKVMVAAFLGMLALVVYEGAMWWDQPWMVTLGLLFSAIFGGALLVYVLAAPRSFVAAKLLDNRLLRTFGRLSFSLYLLHIPVLASQGFWPLDPAVLRVLGKAPEQIAEVRLVIGCSVLAILTLLVHFAVERPFLKLNLGRSKGVEPVERLT